MNNLVVLFTYGISLKTWKTSGLIARELQIYEKMVQDSGLSISLLTYGDSEDLEIAKEYPSLQIIPAYHHIKKTKNSLLRMIRAFFLFQELKPQLPAKYVVKTNQMFGAWAAFLPAIQGHRLTVRCGYELLWTHLRESKGFLNKWIKACFYYFLEGASYTFASSIILTTEHAADFICKAFPWLNPGKITIIPNYIDTNSFAPTDKTTSEKRILFVGRLNRIKNLESLFSAIENSAWSLDVVGQGELEGQLKKEVQKRNLPVRFLGVLPNNSLPQVYNRYRFFLLPSLFENNPKTLMEAMSCGLVACGTSVPGIRQLIEDSKGGLLAEDASSDALKNLLFRMQNLSDAEILEMEHNSRTYATNNFSLESAARTEASIHIRNLGLS